MTPQRKLTLLLFGMELSYMALAMYFALSAQGGAVLIPYWSACFGMAYFLFCTIVGTIAARRWIRNGPKPPVTKKQPILASIALGLFRGIYCVLPQTRVSAFANFLDVKQLR
jgi:hypothetical protein